MHNYYTDFVFTVDVFLAAVSALFAVIIIVYGAAREFFEDRYGRKLFDIKKSIYGSVLAGQKISPNTCLPLTHDATTREFLDIETNRAKGVFFNASEQELFKNCFVTPQKISELENITQKPGNRWRRIEAILSLGYAGVLSSVEILKETVLDKDEEVSYFSMIALGQIKTADSAKALLLLLKNNAHNRYKIASILEGFPEGAADEAVMLMDDLDPSVRFWALKVLSKWHPGRFLKKIEKLTEDPFPDVRAAACECLGETAKKESAGVLKKRLKDNVWLVRMNAVTAVSKILGEESVPEVVGLINDASLLVIDSVKNAMAEHIRSALPYIEKFLEGSDELARTAAIEALENANPESIDKESREKILKMIKNIDRISAGHIAMRVH